MARLHEQRDDYRERMGAIKEGLEGLRDYLTSSKFNGPGPFDKYVNRDDVLRWLEQNVNQYLD